MSEQEKSLLEIQKMWHGSLKSYLIGFVLSAIFTTLSFLLVMAKLMSGRDLVITLGALALFQAITQLIFFLHVGKEDKPKWELLVCLFMVMVLLIVVFGSLWIMYDLNNRVMVGMENTM